MKLGVYEINSIYKYFIIDDRYYKARNLKNLIALYKGEIKPNDFLEQITDENLYMNMIQKNKTNILFEKEYDNIDNLIYDNIEELIWD